MADKLLILLSVVIVSGCFGRSNNEPDQSGDFFRVNEGTSYFFSSSVEFDSFDSDNADRSPYFILSGSADYEASELMTIITRVIYIPGAEWQEDNSDRGDRERAYNNFSSGLLPVCDFPVRFSVSIADERFIENENFVEGQIGSYELEYHDVFLGENSVHIEVECCDAMPLFSEIALEECGRFERFPISTASGSYEHNIDNGKGAMTLNAVPFEMAELKISAKWELR